MRPIVITGCQRSGTAYVSALLTASGHWCSHERHYTETQHVPPRPGTIECSHAAAPYLDQLEPDVLVVHLVRHPLDVISSLMLNSKFSGGRAPASVKFARRAMPQIRRKRDTTLQATMRYWVEWNAHITPYAGLRWTLGSITPDTVHHVLSLSGRVAQHENIRHAYQLTPSTVNASPRHVPRLTWDDIPHGKLGRRLRDMADVYGFET